MAMQRASAVAALGTILGLGFLLAVPQTALAACVAPPSGLVGWWPGNGQAGDLIGGNGGTLQGDATFAAGRVGLAFRLDGDGDFVSVPDAAALDVGTGDFSIDAWIRTDSFRVLGSIMDKRDPVSFTGYHLFLFAGILGLQMTDSGGFANFISAAPLNDGTFHHVAGTVDRDSATGGKLYVDGTAVLTFNPTSRSGTLDNTADLLIGGHTNTPGFVFEGEIDEFELYDRALSASEIEGIFLAGSDGKCKFTSIEKQLIEGPEEIGIYLPEPTQFAFEIPYSNPNPSTPVRIIDTVPAEFTVLSADDGGAGIVNVFPPTKGKGASATRIEWDLDAGTTSATLTVQIETVQGKGKGHKTGLFKPTTCGPLPFNNGATAFEVDPETGEIVKVLNPDTGLLEAVVVVGPSNALEVEAVAGTKPCAPDGLTVTLLDSTTLRLDWEDNTETGVVYNIYRGTSEDGPFTLIATVSASNHDDTGLSPGTYCYVVKAEFTDTSQEGNESEVVCEVVPE